MDSVAFKPPARIELSRFHGTLARYASSINNSFTTEKAALQLQKDPGLLVTHYLYSQRVCVDPEKVQPVRIVGPDASVIVQRERDSDDINILLYDGRFIFSTPGETGLKGSVENISSPKYRSPAAAIQIEEMMRSTGQNVPARLRSIRYDEDNHPIFKSSNSFNVLERLTAISQILHLEDMDAVDLGSGIGSMAFNSSPFFKSITGLELSGELYDLSLKAKEELAKTGVATGNIAFKRGDFFAKGFDLGHFSFVMFYKPIFENADKLSRLLLQCKPGTHFYAEMMMDVLKNDAFKEIELPPQVSRRPTSHLFVRV